MSEIVIGVDGGGSKTRVLVGTAEGEVLAVRDPHVEGQLTLDGREQSVSAPRNAGQVAAYLNGPSANQFPWRVIRREIAAVFFFGKPGEIAVDLRLK